SESRVEATLYRISTHLSVLIPKVEGYSDPDCLPTLTSRSMFLRAVSTQSNPPPPHIGHSK
ncbi:hypothetical protein ADUPG1_005771, partial [Aduncisulcus paluster]